MDRTALEERVDRLRAEHPGREEFIMAVREFGETLDPDERKTLGRVLLDRQPARGGFDVLREERGWFKRTMRRLERRQGGRASRLP